MSNRKNARPVQRNPESPKLEQLEQRQMMAVNTVVSLPYRLDFNAEVTDTVVDKDGQGTGLTRVQANRLGTEYQAGNIDLDTAAGLLKITSTGSSTAGSTTGSDNTQSNALETQFDGTTSGFAVTARLIGPLSNLNDPFEQSGIYLGPDQDNYVKLVAIRTSEGNFLQFRDEIDGAATVPDVQSRINIGLFNSINTLDLRLIGDASSGKVSAFYAINGGAFVKVNFDITISSAKRPSFFNAASRTGLVVSHKNNVGPITASFDSFEITAGVNQTSRPSVTNTRPLDGSTDIARNTFIAADLSLPNTGGGVNTSTLSSSTVKLIRVSDGRMISGSVNTTGGGDAIVFTPTSILDANTTYRFEITDGVQDTTGAAFIPYTSTFTTGTAGVQTDTSIAFKKEAQTTTAGQRYTSLQFGRDRKLYATTIDGKILRFTPSADGSLGVAQEILTLQTMNGARRSTLSIVFDPASTAENPIAYVSHGQFAGLELKEYDAENLGNPANWTGKITRLSGPNLENGQDLVTGLPRSHKDHQNYQMAFKDGKLYWSQSSQSAMGQPDPTWGYRPETLLSAAILSLDLAKLPASGSVHVQTEGLGSANYNPYAANAPVTIYATGLRSAYDLLFTTDGKLYAATNGSAAGGRTPAKPGVTGTALSNIATQSDYMFLVVPGGYYGHPNPLRGEYILNGGNPTSGSDAGEILPDAKHTAVYPVGTLPEATYKGYVYDFGYNYSPNGMIEYKGDAFGGKLDGKILIVRYSGGDDIMVMTKAADGSITSAQTGYVGLTGFVNPLDLVQDPVTGFIYVAEFGDQAQIPGADARITLLTPTTVTQNPNPGTPTGTPVAALSRNKVYLSDPSWNTAASRPQTIRVINTGTGPMTITAASITGTNAAEFTLTNPVTSTITLQPGQRYDFYVTFRSTNANTLRTAQLQITTNGSPAPLAIALRGLGLGGTSTAPVEPSLQKVLDLFDVRVTVNNPDPNNPAYDINAAPAADEVNMPRLIRAGSGPVTVELLGVFANQVSKTSFGWYEAGNRQTINQLAQIEAANAQSVLPIDAGQITFDPGTGSFGLWGNFTLGNTNRIYRDVYSEDSLNTWETNTANQKKVRFFQLRDASGVVVPNAYVFAFEEFNLSFDSNDIIGIIRNVQPSAIAAEIGLENLDSGQFADRLVMSRVRNLDTELPNTVHDTATLRIRNTGDRPLEITGMSISSPDFVFVSGNGPTTLAVGGFVDVKVKFVYNRTGDGNELRNANLVINSNDPDESAKTVKLAGLWQSYSENQPNGQTAEPVASRIIETLGYKIDVGTNNLNFPGSGAQTPLGQETLSELWTKADNGKAVNVTQLAAYHQQKLFKEKDANGNLTGVVYPTREIFAWYTNTSGTITSRNVFAHRQSDGQTLFPMLENSSTAYAAGSFNPANNAAFGFNIGKVYSQDELNAGKVDPNTGVKSGEGHGLRLYAARDQAGNVIPDTYLLLQDYVNVSFANHDYQDNIYLITNIKPVSAPAKAFTPTITGSSANIALDWANSAEGDVTGYNVYRSSSASGVFEKINEQPLSASAYVDIYAPPGATSYYYVTAVTQHGVEGPASNTVDAFRAGAVVVTAPAAPTTVTAQDTSPTSVTVSWQDKSSDETGFRIERRNNGGAYQLIATTAANAASYVDNTVSAGVTYNYRVIAFNSAGVTAGTNESVITVQQAPTTAPAAPSNVTTSATTPTSVSVAWADNSTNESGFRIERRTGGGAYAAIANVLGNSTSYVDNTAALGTTYTYRVVAINSVGETVSTSESTLTTPTSGALQSVNIGNPTPAGNAAIITNQRSYDVTVGGLDIWGTYDSFHFLHHQRIGDFDVSVKIEGITQANIDSQAGLMVRESLDTGSRNIMIKARAGNGFRQSVREVTNGQTVATGTGAATFPNVFVRMVRQGNTFTTFTSADGANWTSFGSTTMALGSTVFLGMATSAKNQTTATTARYRDFGDTVLVQTPAAATNLSATAANNAVALAWNDNATTETGYRVERRAGSGAWASVATLAANAVSYTDASIAAGTTYSYRVIATAAVNGAPSNEATVTTPGGTSSNTTLGTTADGFTKGGTSAGAVFGGSTIEVKHDTNAAFLRFGYVKFDVSGVDGASLTNIKLRLFGGSSQTASTIIPVNVFGAGSAWSESTLTHNTRPANTSGTLGTLSVGPGAQWYEVDVTNHVKAQIAAGATSITFALQGTTTTSPFARFNSRESGSNGPELALTRTVTATPQPPAAASAASATASSQTSVTVTWTDNSTNETGFIVQRRVGAGTWQQVATTTAGATSYTDTSVTAATSYGYRIIATNAVGPAAASNEALVTTPANPVSSTRTLNTTADAYVQDGTSASTNFGTTSGLVVKKGSTGFNRQGYTKFDLSSLTNVNSAKLRVFVTMNVADSMQLAVHSISNDSWTESGLTWNNRPAAGTALATAQVSNKDGAWIEIDLSAHVKAAVAAGQKTLSLNLQSTANSTAFATIASRESGNGAQLVVA